MENARITRNAATRRLEAEKRKHRQERELAERTAHEVEKEREARTEAGDEGLDTDSTRASLLGDFKAESYTYQQQVLASEEGIPPEDVQAHYEQLKETYRERAGEQGLTQPQVDKLLREIDLDAETVEATAAKSFAERRRIEVEDELARQEDGSDGIREPDGGCGGFGRDGPGSGSWTTWWLRSTPGRILRSGSTRPIGSPCSASSFGSGCAMRCRPTGAGWWSCGAGMSAGGTRSSTTRSSRTSLASSSSRSSDDAVIQAKAAAAAKKQVDEERKAEAAEERGSEPVPRRHAPYRSRDTMLGDVVHQLGQDGATTDTIKGVIETGNAINGVYEDRSTDGRALAELARHPGRDPSARRARAWMQWQTYANELVRVTRAIDKNAARRDHEGDRGSQSGGRDGVDGACEALLHRAVRRWAATGR